MMNTLDRYPEIYGFQTDLKSKLHLHSTKVGQEIGSQQECQIETDVECLATELLFRYFNCLANDLQTFSRHAKRSLINSSDMLLFVRRNPQLTRLLKQKMEQSNDDSSAFKSNTRVQAKSKPSERPKAGGSSAK